MKPDADSPESVPAYPLPESAAHFLASENALYDYGNLYRFTRWFRDEYGRRSVSRKPVVILTDSSDQQVFVIAACWLLGIPFAPLSSAQPRDIIREQIRILNPGLLIFSPEHRDKVDEFSSVALAIDKKKLKSESKDNTPSFTEHDPEKVMGYFSTSGSTEKPKIVPIKRRQVFYAASASEQNFKPDRDHYWLLCLPLNHIGGVSIILRSILYGTAIYRMDSFKEDQVLNFLSENRLVQVASLVPTMLHRLLLHSRFQSHLELKAILLGGGRVTPALIQKSVERGLPVVQSYGMTETCAQIAANMLLQPKGTYAPRKSVGHLFAPNQIQIRDNEKKPVKMNESGVIWLRGPQVFDGYLDHNQNEKTFDNQGWFNTGDYGHLNAFGHLFIETRRSDLIVTGAENVNPVDVESALESLREVGQAAVIGIQDEEWGEKIVAFIETAVLQSESESDQIILQLRKLLPSFKIPKEIYKTDSLPRTESGKIRRNELKAQYAKMTSSQSA